MNTLPDPFSHLTPRIEAVNTVQPLTQHQGNEEKLEVVPAEAILLMKAGQLWLVYHKLSCIQSQIEKKESH